MARFIMVIINWILLCSYSFARVITGTLHLYPGKPRFELPVAHAEVVLLALLPEDGEVEYELALSIRDAQEEGFETKDRLVSQVRIYPADVLNTPSVLGKSVSSTIRHTV